MSDDTKLQVWFDEASELAEADYSEIELRLLAHLSEAQVAYLKTTAAFERDLLGYRHPGRKIVELASRATLAAQIGKPQ